MAAGLWSPDGVFVWMRLLFGLAGPLSLIWFVWKTVEIRSTQSATGILYVQLFLVLSGEAVAIVEGQERPMRAWDLLHCPAGTNHVVVGAGDGPCAVLAVGARDKSVGPDWGGYPVDETALRHGAGVEQETTDPDEAYARFGKSALTRYRDGWLPEVG